MLKSILFILFSLVACGQEDASKTEALKFDHRPTQERVAKRLAAGDTRTLAAESFDAMFAVAEKELAKLGYQREALQLAVEWSTTYRGLALGLVEDTGDHKPLSEWVKKWYQKLEDLLGVQIMEMTHLRDIWVLNFTITVVFHGQDTQDWCKEQLAKFPQDSCEAEYRRHFAGTRWEKGPDPEATAALHHGFSGVVTYWVVWAACEAATYGSGAFIICTPIGDMAEAAIEKWVAPGVSDKLYLKANK